MCCKASKFGISWVSFNPKSTIPLSGVMRVLSTLFGNPGVLNLTVRGERGKCICVFLPRTESYMLHAKPREKTGKTVPSIGHKESI